ncbi:hypothetical protein HW555_010670, partial [Spodoptera exigua]
GQSQQPEPSTSTGSVTSRPRRGRPSGANRVPLTLEERRARNAQYERERREDFTAAQTELAEAAGCDPNTSTINLMAFVVTKLKNASEDLSIEEYQRINANLEAQIASCFERLGPEYVLSGDEDDVEPDDSNVSHTHLITLFSYHISKFSGVRATNAVTVCAPYTIATAAAGDGGQSQQPEPSTSTGSVTSRPRRGRPSGANRVPLTLEERRARNAQYERERREDFTAAQTELAEAAGCDPNTSTINLMAFVVTKLKNASEDLSIEEYQRINANLEAQIASCFERLGPEYVLSGDEDDVEPDDSNHLQILRSQSYQRRHSLRTIHNRHCCSWRRHKSINNFAFIGLLSVLQTLDQIINGNLELQLMCDHFFLRQQRIRFIIKTSSVDTLLCVHANITIEEYNRVNAKPGRLEPGGKVSNCLKRLGPEYVLSGSEDAGELDDLIRTAGTATIANTISIYNQSTIAIFTSITAATAGGDLPVGLETTYDDLRFTEL